MSANRVKPLREARAWTQEHLAEAAGVSLRTIQRLENGSGFASETALAVAAALDVDVRLLLEADMDSDHRSLHLVIPAGLAARFVALMVLLVLLPLALFGATWGLRRFAALDVPDFELLHSPLIVLGPPLALFLLWRLLRRPVADVAIRLPLYR